MAFRDMIINESETEFEVKTGFEDHNFKEIQKTIDGIKSKNLKFLKKIGFELPKGRFIKKVYISTKTGRYIFSVQFVTPLIDAKSLNMSDDSNYMNFVISTDGTKLIKE